jgi:hypothetical protein
VSVSLTQVVIWDIAAARIGADDAGSSARTIRAGMCSEEGAESCRTESGEARRREISDIASFTKDNPLPKKKLDDMDNWSMDFPRNKENHSVNIELESVIAEYCIKTNPSAKNR